MWSSAAMITERSEQQRRKGAHDHHAHIRSHFFTKLHNKIPNANNNMDNNNNNNIFFLFALIIVITIYYGMAPVGFYYNML